LSPCAPLLQRNRQKALALPLRLLDEGLKLRLLELAEASERIITNALRVEIDGGSRGGVL
jgi:hypothetical protein